MSLVERTSRPETGAADGHAAARRTAALSSFALMASAVGTAASTYLFWVVVARRDGAAAVGLASSQIATITFLGGAASLNLINVLARFLPVAGRSARRLIVGSYLAAAAAATTVGVAFLLTPWADGATAGGVPGWLFVAMVALSAVFLIQDGGLIGLGRSSWVPLENVAMGVLRLALLPLCALALSGSGSAVLSWGISLAAAVVVLNALVIGRLAPRQQGAPDLPDRRQLGGFIAVESVNTAVSTTLTTFLPAIVTFSLGAVAGGYFYVPWMVISIGTLLLSNVLIAAVRESVANPAAAPAILRSQLRLGGVLVAAAVLCCTLLPALPLSLLGDDFATNAALLLRWLGLAVPGTAIGLLFWAVCLILQRPWPILAVNLVVTSVTVVAVVGYGDRLGLAGVGAVYCAAQTVTGLALLPLVGRWLRPLLRPRPEAHPC